MCIRDRLEASAEDHEKAGLSYVASGNYEGEHWLATFAVLTVSYTHLRAHETVLDLVCRLLLEKKKTERSISILQAPHRHIISRLQH